ncbi:hypothetical protein O6P43_027521 [Quillaja saponaria]|uniref:Uncharacterized protein n=1 Tax=Quillaja saponaria TaxID=32244 RepID=A0AAD7L552_QUISA|nr:hypothetical protein O6P43_027521 [Quillaja saponaria]
MGVPRKIVMIDLMGRRRTIGRGSESRRYRSRVNWNNIQRYKCKDYGHVRGAGSASERCSRVKGAAKRREKCEGVFLLGLPSREKEKGCSLEAPGGCNSIGLRG